VFGEGRVGGMNLHLELDLLARGFFGQIKLEGRLGGLCPLARKTGIQCTHPLPKLR